MIKTTGSREGWYLPTVGCCVQLHTTWLLRNHCLTVLNVDIVMWEHMFWLFGHPEVYVLLLGSLLQHTLSLTIITIESLTINIGLTTMNIDITSTCTAIGIVSLLVWAHHL